MEDDNFNQKTLQNNRPTYFTKSFIFEENIDRLWLFLCDLNNETKAIDYLDNLKFLKGNKTFIKGNIFSVNWIGLTLLQYECIFLKDEDDRKIIKWKAKGDIGLNFIRSLYLYKITQNNNTLVKVSVSLIEKETDLIDYNPSKNYFSNLEYNILLDKSKSLKNSKEDIFLFGSCIINKNFFKIWKIILNFKKLSNIYPIKGEKIQFNEPIVKVGVFIKMFIEELKITTFMKVIEIKTFKKRKSWLIKLETIGAFITNLPKAMEYKIIMIDNYKTQFSITYFFPFNINPDIIQKFEMIKKDALKIYKKTIEEDNEGDEKENNIIK